MVVIINGREHDLRDTAFGGAGTWQGTLSYGAVVALAFDQPREALHTVTYSFPKGSDRRSGSLVPGQFVALEAGMIFTAAVTDGA